MSVVPYNNEILYHDPNHGILVVRNNKEITVLLLGATKQHGTVSLNNTNPPRRDSMRYSNSSIGSNLGGNQHTCPNCGFGWTEHKRRGSSPDSTNFGGGTFPQGFMHHDYFKLLSRLPSSEKDKFKIPTGIFNQGYFQRFFKKVPPYTLGSGANAQVYKVVHVLNDIKIGTYAVKRISIGDKFELLEHVLNEVFILYELSVKGANENNLIRYNHVWLELGGIDDLNTFFLPSESSSPKVTEIPYVFILQQYCGGGNLDELISKNFKLEAKLSWEERVTLEKHKRRTKRGKEQEINSRKWLSNFETWKFFRDVVNGVNYLHLNGILHRDLKPSNCLLDEKYDSDICGEVELFETFGDLKHAQLKLPKVLVSDFGEGKFLSKHELAENVSIKVVNEERQGNTGTLEFTAPELWLFSDPSINGKRYINEFSFESDVYSLGLILCYLCVGTLPFSDLIAGESDPHLVRTNIMDWYFQLTTKSFDDWFFETVGTLRLNDEKSREFLLVFSGLIYMMIKGDDLESNSGHNRAIAADVLSTLDLMQERFVKNLLENYDFGKDNDREPLEDYEISVEEKSSEVGDPLEEDERSGDEDPLEYDVRRDDILWDPLSAESREGIPDTKVREITHKNRDVLYQVFTLSQLSTAFPHLCLYLFLETSYHKASMLVTLNKILSIFSIMVCLSNLPSSAKLTVPVLNFAVGSVVLFGIGQEE